MRRAYRHDIAVDLPIDRGLPSVHAEGRGELGAGLATGLFRAEKTARHRRTLLFATGTGDERTWWTCLAYEPEACHVRYLRLTPDSRAAFVDVTCRARDARSTLVTVGYDIQVARAVRRNLYRVDDGRGLRRDDRRVALSNRKNGPRDAPAIQLIWISPLISISYTNID